MVSLLLCKDNIKHKPSKHTIYNYLSVLENAKIISKCSRFDLKSKKSLTGEEKYYLTDLSFYFATNTDNRINYGPVLENIIYNYAVLNDYSVSIGKIGKLEVDFIVRDIINNNYACIQVAKTIDNGIVNDKGIPIIEDREYRPLESIKDNYPKYVLTLDTLLQQRYGIKHENIIKFIFNCNIFKIIIVQSQKLENILTFKIQIASPFEIVILSQNINRTLLRQKKCHEICNSLKI